ncbi:MAG: TetR/AcrR family transcriptional regulator [Firmicutes bacterium]|nr:TetR/AcrR family transcriptional regulator [Bacillota bacterium]
MQYKKKYINDKILEAGLAEYLEKGYRQGNISAIAQNAGVPVGNLYRYFDGKSGLLDALVKNVYTEIPKTVERLANFDAQNGLSVEGAFLRLASSLADIFDSSGKEIIILVDKCGTTRYEDFSEKTIEQVANLVYDRLYNDEQPFNRLMSRLMARAFVRSLFDILRLHLPRAEMQAMVLKTMKFYFYGIDARK